MYKCKVCNRKMEVTEIDKTEGIAWVCCPDYMEGDDKHDSYQVKLTEEVEEIFFKQG